MKNSLTVLQVFAVCASPLFWMWAAKIEPTDFKNNPIPSCLRSIRKLAKLDCEWNKTQLNGISYPINKFTAASQFQSYLNIVAAGLAALAAVIQVFQP
jgi:hypothetical protein